MSSLYRVLGPMNRDKIGVGLKEWEEENEACVGSDDKLELQKIRKLFGLEFDKRPLSESLPQVIKDAKKEAFDNGYRRGQATGYR